MVEFEEDYDIVFEEVFEDDFEPEMDAEGGFCGVISRIMKRQGKKLLPSMNDYIDQ